MRWHEKADAFVLGWRERFNGETPSLHTVVLGLSVAQHETACGDSWAGEHNWGAVQKRVPSAQEKTELKAANIIPYYRRVVKAGKAVTESSVPAARAVIADAIRRGMCPDLDREALHIDSSPGKGWYFVYFWAFPDDVGGASFFIKIIAVNRGSCLAVLKNPAGTALQLADAMYRTRYYEGFYVKTKKYQKVNGKWISLKDDEETSAPVKTGAELNVAAYGGALAAIAPSIQAALSSWSPPQTPTEEAEADTDPAPAIPWIPLEVDWDEIRRARDDIIRDDWED